MPTRGSASFARLASGEKRRTRRLRLRRRRVHLRALAAATGGFGLLLPALHARLHVVAAHLQLTEDAFRGELPLEHLDRTLDPAVADDHLEGLALNRFTRHLTFSGDGKSADS